MGASVGKAPILVLGLGNTLLSDDGIGIHVMRALQDRSAADTGLAFCDGGTIGLALLADIEDARNLIVVDAMELGEAPGTVRRFVGPDMDRQLTGKKKTAHEVALADLMMAAALSGFQPERRALVAIQPEKLGWGLAATPAVAAAIPEACGAILRLAEDWTHG
jgi:hydrogenase maturation protease